MPKTVIGLFDDYQKAQDVMEDLVDSGIEADRISTITEADKSKYSQDTTSTHGPVTTTEHGAGGMSAPVESATRTLLDLGMPENKAKYYAEAVRRGGTLVCVAGVDDGDLDNAVITAVINKRAGGMGLISGRKAFQRPMKEGIALLNAIQDVYLSKDVTVA